ncbi:MAG: ribonuclease E/G [Clostridiaceae bacterium]|nr:ribonuclease E/G [Clostridiaceae bacterium]
MESSELAIYPSPEGVCHVLLEDGRAVEYLVDDQSARPRRLDLYLGVVKRITPAIKGVFIDIGDDHDALLNLGEAPVSVRCGQRLIVQIKRITGDGKGHQVTTRIQLPGPYAVVRIGETEKRRSKLLAFPPDQQEKLFQQDLVRLQSLWRHIQDDSTSGPAPRRLYPLGHPLYMALISFLSAKTRQIRIEGDVLFAQVYQQIQELMPEYLPLLSLYRPGDGYGLASALSLAGLPEQLRRSKIWLDHGGYLIIEHTEALTVADVNSGRDIQGKTDADLRLRTNLEAAAELARQIRLRNIGGIIIVDFVNLGDDEARSRVQEALKQALASDRAHCRLVGFTGLGLYEMTRTAL